MTALEQQLNQELLKTENIKVELIQKIENQEIEFIKQLQQMQKANELNLKIIVESNKELNNQLFQKLQILEESLQNLLIS